MDISRIKPCRKYSFQHVAGLTLIEVLIALAIIGIAMTAVIKASTQNIRATNYLQEKTIATWVGQQVINEARVDLLAIPKSEKLKQKTSMLNKDWYWEASEETTPNKRIKKIEVSVFPGVAVDAEENNDASPIVTLTGYVYAKE